MEKKSMPKEVEYNDEEFEALSSEKGTGATVDWDGFAEQAKGKILTLKGMLPIYQGCGGVSEANLRGKLERLAKKGVVEKKFDGRTAVYKVL